MEAQQAPSEDVAAPAARAPNLWLRGFVVFCALLALFAGSALATCSYHMFAGEPFAPKPVTSTVVRGTSSIITAMHDLAVLQGSSYYVERVIDLKDKQSHMFGLVESEDAILLVAAGEVTAGVDLSLMREGDVRIDPDSKVAYITMPAATILSAHLDNDRTYVHTRKTDALAQRAETLETRARQEAESSLREAAISGGILERADKNAAHTLEVLVRSLGFDRVVISAPKD